jgi:putative transposase
MKYRLMNEQREIHPVEKMAKMLGVARSGYYAWVSSPESHREVRQKELTQQIKEIHDQVHHRYGSPRITKELARRGRPVGHNHVARIMRENKLWARTKRRFVITTRSAQGQEVAKNLLGRQFQTSAANRMWVSDITYVATAEGWMYLCIVLDLYSRRIVGWSMSAALDTKVVMAAFRMAVIRRRPPRGLIFHSDRGTQYTSIQFRAVLRGHGFLQSMSRKGDCWDNACAETFFKTLKTELIHLTIYRSREEAREAIFEYLEVFYNRVRLHSYLGYTTPVEYEEAAPRCSVA